MNIKTECLLVYLACCISVSLCDPCLKIDFSLTQKVENEGFHRDIQWFLELATPNITNWINSQCLVMILMKMNAGMFVNKDEIAELNRFREVLVRIDDTVNIETPSHESTEHLTYSYLPSNFSEQLIFNLPIHLRYQRAQITGKYGKVHLTRPNVMVSCKKDVVFCGRRQQAVKAPCLPKGEDQCTWKNMTYQSLFEDVEMFIPIGDLDDYPLVSIVSLLLGCAGCIYVLSLLSSAPL